jgi:CubicO group peptidase (beta-lactamase class C family)
MPTKPRIDALMISKNGATVLEEYFGSMAADTLHIISSCTKSITALLAGIAIDRGLFGLDDKIADHFPGASMVWGSDDNRTPVLVRHVLSMMAGTEHTVKDAQDLLESTDVEQLVLGWTLAAAPGERYNYDNGFSSLVGCLIERTSRIPLVDFADKYLFGPTGITKLAWANMPIPTDRPYMSDPPVLAAGGMALTFPDFLKLGQMLLQNGQYNGQQISPSAYVTEATPQQTGTEDYPYGYYFHVNQRESIDSTTKEWIHLEGMDDYFMLGQGEQILFIAPKEQIVMAAFSSTWHRDQSARPDRYAIMKVTKVALDSLT